ncbi:hypothetical protein SLEP1_g19010 [Rubroshorea leprosula]|nr:hypothetical protein SLEP1_g19010 [Rubroshorea leprosula]
MNMVQSLMSKSILPKEFWPEAVNWSVHILNRSLTSSLPNMKPKEAWNGRKLAIDYFRNFGCIAYAHVPDQKRSKLDDKGEKCIFLGIPIDFKNGKDLIVQNSRGQMQQNEGLTLVNLETSRKAKEESLLAAEHSTRESLPTTPELESGTSSQPQHKKRRLASLEDYEVTNLPQDDVLVTHFALFANCDPLTYEKWIYKTKLKENGKVGKFKARLVAKGYKQEFGIDYQEVFAPVVRMDTIRLVIALVAQNSWPIYQLDVKSAFLHGDLQE